MSGHEGGSPIPALERLGGEFDRAAAAPRPPRARLPLRGERTVLVGWAAVAVAVVAFAFTPPGRAVADWIGGLVGIGGVGQPASPEFRSQVHHHVHRGSEPTVIATGRMPGGARYEVDAYRYASHMPKAVYGLNGHRYPTATGYTCLTVHMPSHPKDTIPCTSIPDRGDVSATEVGGVKGGNTPPYFLAGTTTARVRRVEVRYPTRTRTTRTLTTRLARLTPRLARRAGVHQRGGLFIAFLPRAFPPGPFGNPFLGRLDVLAYDRSGTVIGTAHWGLPPNRTTHLIAAAHRMERRERRALKALPAPDGRLLGALHGLGFDVSAAGLSSRLLGRAQRLAGQVGPRRGAKSATPRTLSTPEKHLLRALAQRGKLDPAARRRAGRLAARPGIGPGDRRLLRVLAGLRGALAAPTDNFLAFMFRVAPAGPPRISPNDEVIGGAGKPSHIPPVPVPRTVVKGCRRLEAQASPRQPHYRSDLFICLISQARASGKLKPGDYTNRQLARILIEAFPKYRALIRHRLEK